MIIFYNQEVKTVDINELEYFISMDILEEQQTEDVLQKTSKDDNDDDEDD